MICFDLIEIHTMNHKESYLLTYGISYENNNHEVTRRNKKEE